MYCVIVYMLTITISSWYIYIYIYIYIFCYCFLALFTFIMYPSITESICPYNNKQYIPCINITILNEHAYLKITLILFVKHFAYTLYSTIITPIFISRLRIDVIVLTPSTINYIYISMVMCMHPMLTLPSPFILLCTVSLTVETVSSIKFDKRHVYKQLYTCIYTHLNKYNQLVIVISYLYSDCRIYLCIIMYLCCIIYHLTLSTKCLNHTIIYIMNAHVHYYPQHTVT